MHTVRTYRDALTMLFKFIASYRGRAIASLQLGDIDADAVLHRVHDRAGFTLTKIYTKYFLISIQNLAIILK